LFNFAASYSAGGLKRLSEYARLRDEAGGSAFIIHPRSRHLEREFPRNRYFVADQSALDRLIHDGAYMPAVIAEIGTPDLYYSYGIPMYQRVGRVNWFHLTNSLTMTTRGIPLHLGFKLKVQLLGVRIRRVLGNADIISAESRDSLRLMGTRYADRYVVSVNGSDDEIAYHEAGRFEAPEQIATTIGTYTYKAIGDSYRIFRMLRERHPALRFTIVGPVADIPAEVRGDAAVTCTGVVQRPEVIGTLRRSRFYISTTYIENSYNAASEGAFLSEESYLSDIGPHRELLDGMPFDEIRVPGVARPLLHVRRADLTRVNLRSWRQVLDDVLARTESVLQSRAASVGAPA
jgi:glycosyltransferase involved in cell wall biosynthesis